MILSAIAERLKRQSKDDFKGRHFEASLILQADRCRGSAAFNLSARHDGRSGSSKPCYSYTVALISRRLGGARAEPDAVSLFRTSAGSQSMKLGRAQSVARPTPEFATDPAARRNPR